MVKPYIEQDSYTKILSRIEKDPTLQSLESRPNNVVYFYKDEIGHPESILVTKSPSGEYRIIELTHEYDERTQVRGKRAYFGRGGQGSVGYGRDLKTGEVVAVKKGGTRWNEYRYQAACKLDSKAQEAGVNSPVIDVYAYGESYTKPQHKRKNQEQHKRGGTFYAIMKMGERALGNTEAADKNNLNLSPIEKTNAVIDALRFAVLLRNNDAHFGDYKSRNVLLDAEHRFKVCDLEGFETYEYKKKEGIPLVFVEDLFAWLYPVKSNAIDANRKKLIEKLKSKNITNLTDVTEEIVSEIGKAIAACDAVIKKNNMAPPSEKTINETKAATSYSKKDIFWADLSYFVSKGDHENTMGMLLHLAKEELNSPDRKHIISTLADYPGDSKPALISAVLEHPGLFDFFSPKDIVDNTSEEQQIKLLKKIGVDYQPPKDLVDAVIIHLFKNCEKVIDGNKLNDVHVEKLRKLHALLKEIKVKDSSFVSDLIYGKVDEKIKFTNDYSQKLNKLNSLMNTLDEKDKRGFTDFSYAQVDAKIESIEVFKLLKLLTMHLQDEEKHPPHRKSTLGSLFKQPALNLAHAETLIRKSNVILNDRVTPTYLVNILNEYLNGLLANIAQNHPQQSSRYLNSLKDFLKIEHKTELKPNHFNKDNIGKYIHTALEKQNKMNDTSNFKYNS